MVLFPTGIGGEGVGYGYKGKGVMLHSITDANGMPVVAVTTPANADERQQVLPLLDKIRLATLKRGNPKRRPEILAADKGYDARWLRKRLLTKGIRPQIKRRQWSGKKHKGRPIRGVVPRYQQERSFSWFQRKYRRLVVRYRTPQGVFRRFPPPGLFLYLVSEISGIGSWTEVILLALRYRFNTKHNVDVQMANISLRHVPDELYEQIKEIAERERRSVNQ